MHHLVRGALAAATLLAAAVPGFAQQPTQAQANAIRQACRADYQSHCASVPTGGSAAMACLQQNAASLSQPCQQALAPLGAGAAPATSPPAQAPAANAPAAAPATAASRRQEMAMLRADCRPDYRKFCADIQPGGGRVLACLHAHGPQLSRPCQSALLALRSAQ